MKWKNTKYGADYVLDNGKTIAAVRPNTESNALHSPNEGWFYWVHDTTKICDYMGVYIEGCCRTDLKLPRKIDAQKACEEYIRKNIK